MYRLKQIPEDFIVKERLNFKIDDNGKYSYYLLKKRDYTTFSAIEFISRKLKIEQKFINAAGLKDRQGITEQFISISNGPKKDFDFTDIQLFYKGTGKERFNIGTLEGNEFEITIRNLEPDFDTSSLEYDESFYVPNFFDTQRFGRDGDNHEIGKLMLERRFKEAAEILVGKKEGKVGEFLNKYPNDFIGALRMLPKKIIKFYLTAYQSHLWNLAIKEYVKEDPDFDEEFPQPGFNVDFEDEDQEDIMISILKKENIALRDFVIRSFPEISLDGSPRRVFAKAQGFTLSDVEDDELNPTKKKVVAKFYLGKGSYATNVIKYLFRDY